MVKLSLISKLFNLTTLAYITLSFASETRSIKGSENQYTVVAVQGKILFHQLGLEMKRGDIYINGTALDFITNAARAAVANEISGRFVLTANKKNQVNMLPATNPISSRAGGILNLVDLKKHFEGKLMFIEEGRIRIGNGVFPQDDQACFYVQYEHLGEVIPKKLNHDGEFVIINKLDLFMVDGKSIPVEEKEMTLFYKSVDKSYKITNFTPVFPEPAVLKQEMTLLFESGGFDSADQRLVAAESFATDFYGKPDRTNLSEWLKQEFNEQ